MIKKVINIKAIMMIIVLLSMNLWSCGEAVEEDGEDEVAVKVVDVVRGNIIEEVFLSSTLQPKESTMVFPRTPGLEVTKLMVSMGDTVSKGDLLFELDKAPVRRQVEVARKNYEQAQRNYRFQKQQYEAATEMLPANLPNGTMVFQQSRAPIENNVSEGALLTAEAQLEQARLAYVNALEQLEEMEYYAPIDGIVSQINIQENQQIINTQPAIVITNNNELKTELYVTRELLDILSIDKTVNIHIGDKTRQGRIAALNTVANPTTGLHVVKIVLDNSEEQVSSSFCRVAIQRQNQENVLLIPKEAILLENNRPIVFVEEENKAYKRQVELGIDNGSMVEITNGLEEGGRVVVRGQHYIEEGTSLLIVGGEGNGIK